jgi:hypothetical protein
MLLSQALIHPDPARLHMDPLTPILYLVSCKSLRGGYLYFVLLA